MKKKLFIGMAAACTALMAAIISCQKNNGNDNGDNGDEPATAENLLVGIWENVDPDGFLGKFRINEDGTGEVFYPVVRDPESSCAYAVKFYFEENKVAFSIDGIDENLDASDWMTYSFDEQNRLCVSGPEGLEPLIFEKTEEWGDYGITNIFQGSWESDDSYDKFYLNVEPYEFFNCESNCVFVEGNDQFRGSIDQGNDAARDYSIFLEDRMRFLNFYQPTAEGDCLKVKMTDTSHAGQPAVERILKPMAEWPYKHYDEF